MKKENTIKITLKREPLGEERIQKEKEKKQRIFFVIACLLLFTFGIVVGLLFNDEGKLDTKSDEIKKIIKNNWLYRNDYDDLDTMLDDLAYKGMATFDSDPYTAYMSNKEATDYYDSQINMSYVGVGLSYLPGSFIVSRVYKNSPAEIAGFEVGDIIISCNDIPFKGKTSEEASFIVLGEEGTEIDFVVKRDNELVNIKAKRGKFEQTVDAYKLDKDTVYLQIMSFGINSGNECIEYLNDYKDCSKIIIDLRDNTGGYETSVQEIAGLFLGKDQVVMHKNYTSLKKDTDYTISNAYYDNFKKIVILCNGYTASASEVLILALKEGCDNVTVVGEKTYGKGVMQSKYNLGDGSSLKLTVANWTSPSGLSINGIGIEPDKIQENHKILDYVGVSFDETIQEYYEYDSVSTYVNIMQYALDYLGYKIDRFDGYFSKETLSALNEFKKENNMEIDGILDSDTYVSILAKVIKEKNTNINKDLQLNKGRELLNG